MLRTKTRRIEIVERCVSKFDSQPWCGAFGWGSNPVSPLSQVHHRDAHWDLPPGPPRKWGTAPSGNKHSLTGEGHTSQPLPPSSGNGCGTLESWITPFLGVDTMMRTLFVKCTTNALPNTFETARSLELSAYMTCCKLQPSHLLLSLREAIKLSVRCVVVSRRGRSGVLFDCDRREPSGPGQLSRKT